MKKTDLDKILNEALNKALIGKNKIKQVNSNEIADFVNKHLEAINYTHSCTELQAIEELKDFAYNNCQLHNTDQLEEIIERL
mgnify:CR=1 FL=1